MPLLRQHLASSSVKHLAIVTKRLSFAQTITECKKQAKSIGLFDTVGPLSLKGMASPGLTKNEGSGVDGPKGGRSSRG
jgi:hypothetical protein